MIACRTLIGRGVPRIENQRVAHGGKLFPKDADEARAALGWIAPPFEIPEDILSAWREAGARGAAADTAWQARLAAADPETRAEFQRLLDGRLPEGWERVLHAAKQRYADEGADPTDDQDVERTNRRTVGRNSGTDGWSAGPGSGNQA